MPANMLEYYSKYFDRELLQKVKLRWDDTMPLIDFDTGDIPALDFSQSDGLTLIDLVLLHRQVNQKTGPALIFHELVHCLQFELLGVERFLKEYILGYIENGFDYYKIPLEVEAYFWQNQFENAPNSKLLVTEELRKKYQHER